jgi:hypothetical protein
MVRAIIEGRKTQTRRIVKYPSTGAFVCVQGYWTSQTADEWWPLVSLDGESASDNDGNETPMRCPYGKPGDRLWVRETFSYLEKKSRAPVAYRANTPEGERVRVDAPWVPSIHMPRWASRITLEIADVRVQRLRDIGEADAKAEGADPVEEEVISNPAIRYRSAFHSLWSSIHGLESWSINPWVWAVTFKRVGAIEAAS